MRENASTSQYRRLDYAPAVALLLFWATSGLLGALTIAGQGGGLRHLALGGVTLPALGWIAQAALRIRRARRG
jgi:hypothetical protein